MELIKMKKDGTTSHSKHLEGVVNRLKSLGVIDEELLSTGWLHDTIEDTETTFDELFEKFGQRIAVLVMSLSKDNTLPRKQREKMYVKKLKESSKDAKLIKLCDISTNLSDLKNSNISKSKKQRSVRQIRHYLIVIRNNLLENNDYPKIITLLESINQNLTQFGQRTIHLQIK
ncbi:MAG: bifunctional (p)ppGpp synthetase/guanosine-3',5'-bis(diphosphate) 3'-pyrophosphohydrolase [Thaumarchaeota archaeon]|nr:MAG: bifunctional (p)ppGpp synthetase/guanosine-3',5'-bis(diphosphate) 3'-pyrophosphohydrolase [Nitrososphaerota archaeon]